MFCDSAMKYEFRISFYPKQGFQTIMLAKEANSTFFQGDNIDQQSFTTCFYYSILFSVSCFSYNSTSHGFKQGSRVVKKHTLRYIIK